MSLPELGQRLLDRFEIEAELGRGGHSVVYGARDLKLRADVALKVLVPPPNAAVEAKERLRREVETVRTLHHPNIVAVHDLIDDGPQAFIVMDRVDGTDLATLLRTNGPLSLEQALRLGREIGGALAAAHQSGILHRDVKPANILLDRSGKAWLADFGSARLTTQSTMTRTGGLVGTVAYLSPEVWLGGRPDVRADLYALGVSLFEAVTGRLPPVVSPHLPPTPDPKGYHPAALRPDLPPWFDQIIAMATRAEPRYRFATAAQFLDALEEQRFPNQPIPEVSLAPTIAPSPPGTPIGLVVLIAGILAVGAMAGISASAHFFWATPAVAGLLWRAGRKGLTIESQPHAGPTAPQWQLTGAAATIYRRIPPGPARVLVEDVLVLARGQVDRAGTPALAEHAAAQLEPLVATAVLAAADLADADDVLKRLEGGAGRVREVPAGYWDQLADLERTRDGISTALLDLVGTLGRSRGAAIDDVDSARIRLDELVGELKSDVADATIAARDLELALR